MGFRDYSPGLNRFTTRDMYNGALADMNLGTDPFTGNRYAFGGGNPTSYIEYDGHYGFALVAAAAIVEVAAALITDEVSAQQSGRKSLMDHMAGVQGEAEIIRLLLAAGARPDTESGHGSEGTPLCATACWGHTETVRALLAYGADPNLREDHGTGRAPLEWALNGPVPKPPLFSSRRGPSTTAG